MKKFIVLILIIISGSINLFAQRIKDIAYITGQGSQQVIGYGLVVGLAGSGDTQRSTFTLQSITSMLKRFGITVPTDNLQTRNVAAVMVTATLDSQLKPGAEFDVTVSSMGDASSLSGGTLLLTPLSSIIGKVYGYAQGALSVGGYDIRTSSGNRIAKNHSLAGRVPMGGILQLSIDTDSLSTKEVNVYLRAPDMNTANNIMTAINSKFGNQVAMAKDPAEIRVKVPNDKQNNIVGFLAELESITVLTDESAKVVLDERSGTVVAGNNVKILPASITHGNLNITIRSYPIISQPGPFSNGTTQVFNNAIPYASQDSTNTIAIQGASTVQQVASALNSLKVSPQDIIAIFQALKKAGALIGELVII
ncbi:MAG: flagellar basal body P-ring protein FlgI [Ignavibacteriaceae bacterium]|nr:flagellar basal body P-ring protein FlgI [Ignavibacteriaceae bacterium]